MNSRDEWERMIAGWAPVPTKELSMSGEIKLSTEEIDAMRDGLEAIGYGSTAAAIKQLQQELAAAREALQSAEALITKWRDSDALNDGPSAMCACADDLAATLQRDRQP